MSLKKPSRKQMRSLCAEVHPDDGSDPREWSRKGRPGERPRRKTLQLCSQVAEVLSDVLAGDCGDEMLQSLQVMAVDPAPDASRLLVTVSVPPALGSMDPGRVLEHLAHASGRLRCEVAASITRRRTPVLGFRVSVGPR